MLSNKEFGQYAGLIWGQEIIDKVSLSDPKAQYINVYGEDETPDPKALYIIYTDRYEKGQIIERVDRQTIDAKELKAAKDEYAQYQATINADHDWDFWEESEDEGWSDDLESGITYGPKFDYLSNCEDKIYGYRRHGEARFTALPGMQKVWSDQ